MVMKKPKLPAKRASMIVEETNKKEGRPRRSTIKGAQDSQTTVDDQSIEEDVKIIRAAESKPTSSMVSDAFLTELKLERADLDMSLEQVLLKMIASKMAEFDRRSAEFMARLEQTEKQTNICI